MSSSEFDSPLAYPYEAKPLSGATKAADPLVTWNWPAWMPLGAVAGFGLLTAFSVCPLMATFRQNDWGAAWVYMCFGVIGAQGVVAAVALAWTSGPFLVRFVGHWSAVALAVAVWAAGLCASVGFDPRRMPGFDERGIWMVLWIFPILSLSIQLPLWLVRQYFGWRLVQREHGLASIAGEALSIRDLFIGTLIVGFAMMAARVADWLEPAPGIWIGLGIATAIIMAVTAISALPIGMWLLKWSNWQLGMALVAAEAILAAAITFGITYSFGAIRSTTNLSELFGLVVVIGSYAAMLSAAALAARAAGYRLEIGRLSGGAWPEFEKR